MCVASEGTGEISQAACETWLEQILLDLGSSGETGEDLVYFFRLLDAQHDGKFKILFQDLFGGGMAPPLFPGIVLDSKMYLETVGTDAWYFNVGVVAHEIGHQNTSNWARITARSEIAASQLEARVRTDLFHDGKGRPPGAYLTDALAVDINDWDEVRHYQEKHMEGQGNPVYDWEPTWGIRRDSSEMTSPIWRAVRDRIYERWWPYFVR